jgi:hypothetical protein
MKFLSNVIIVRLAFYADAEADPAIHVQKVMVVIMSCCLQEVYTVHTAAIYPPTWLTMGSHCSTTGKPTHLFRTKCVSLDSV